MCEYKSKNWKNSAAIVLLMVQTVIKKLRKKGYVFQTSTPRKRGQSWTLMHHGGAKMVLWGWGVERSLWCFGRAEWYHPHGVHSSSFPTSHETQHCGSSAGSICHTAWTSETLTSTQGSVTSDCIFNDLELPTTSSWMSHDFMGKEFLTVTAINVSTTVARQAKREFLLAEYYKTYKWNHLLSLCFITCLGLWCGCPACCEALALDGTIPNFFSSRFSSL